MADAQERDFIELVCRAHHLDPLDLSGPMVREILLGHRLLQALDSNLSDPKALTYPVLVLKGAIGEGRRITFPLGSVSEAFFGLANRKDPPHRGRRGRLRIRREGLVISIRLDDQILAWPGIIGFEVFADRLAVLATGFAPVYLAGLPPSIPLLVGHGLGTPRNRN